MEHWENAQNNSEMVIYTTADGLTKIETTFDGDTVWLSLDQMAELFQRDKSIISSSTLILIQECLGILAARCASCNCMTYFYCAPLQSCRRLYQLGD